MEDLRYIFGKPIPIEGIGILSALTMDEYIENNGLFGVLTITVKTLLQTIDITDKEKRKEAENNVKAFDLICGDQRLLIMLLKLFEISFKADRVFFNPNKQSVSIEYIKDEQVAFTGTVNRENYDFVRNSIIKVNNLRLPKQAKTKELQEWFDKEDKAKSLKNKCTFEDVITSIMTYTHYTPEQLSRFTVYQINKLIERIIKHSEYESNVKFLCAGAQNIKLESWCSNIPDSHDKADSLEKFKQSVGF